MTTEHRLAFAAAAALLGACASTSPGRDLARVEELARLPLPVSAAGAPVEPGPPPEVRDLVAKPLTPDSAVRIALLHNRELRAVLRDVAAARGRAAQAGTLPNPAFEFDLRRPTDRELPLQKDVLLEYELTTALLTAHRSSVAEAEVSAERVRAAASAVELGYRVRSALFAFQGAEQRLAVSNRALDSLAAGRDAARALFQAGHLRELDLAAEEAAYEGARATVAEVELELLDRREALQRLLGLHGALTAWTAVPPPPLPDTVEPAGDDTEAGAVRASLALAEIRSRLEAVARRTGLTRAEGWIPDVSVDVHAEQDERSWELGGGARITVPLFDRRQGTLAAQEAEFDGLMDRYHGVAVDVRSGARAARVRLESAHARARQYTGVVVPARRRVVEQALRQFNAMAINVFELLRFQRELLDAELASADAVRDYWTARATAEAIGAGMTAPGTPVGSGSRAFTTAAGVGGH